MDEKIEHAGLDDEETVRKFGKSLFAKLREKSKELENEYNKNFKAKRDKKSKNKNYE